jgi:membrane protease YdiL (CAAX protease family)
MQQKPIFRELAPGKRLNGPWSFRQGLAVLLVFILSFIALSGMHMMWVRETIGFDAYLGDGPRMPPALLMTSQIIKAVTLLAAVWLVALKARHLTWADVGFRPCQRRWLLVACLLAVLGTISNLFLAKFMVLLIPDWSAFMSSRYALGDGSALQMAVLILMTIIITPVVEEVFFRGFLFQWMATHRPIWLAILVSSIMFGVSHILPPQIIVTSVMSMLIIFLFLKSRSIWPCIVCHITNNALGVGFGIAAVSGQLPAWLTPPV